MDTYFEADIAGTSGGNEVGRQAIKDPLLIVEILSPSTEPHDRRVKLPAYQQISPVEEIVLIASDGLYAELDRRTGVQWMAEHLRGGEGVLALSSVGLEIPLSDLYEGIALGEPES